MATIGIFNVIIVFIDVLVDTKSIGTFMFPHCKIHAKIRDVHFTFKYLVQLFIVGKSKDFFSANLANNNCNPFLLLIFLFMHKLVPSEKEWLGCDINSCSPCIFFTIFGFGIFHIYWLIFYICWIIIIMIE